MRKHTDTSPEIGIFTGFSKTDNKISSLISNSNLYQTYSDQQYANFNRLFLIHNDSPADNIFATHYHSAFELAIIFDGEVTLSGENHSANISRNQGFIVMPFELHSLSKVRKEDPYDRLIINFLPEIVPKEYLETLYQDIIIFGCTQNILSTARGIDGYLKSGCSDEHLFSSLLNVLMYEIINSREKIELLKDTKTRDKHLQEIIEYIDGHISEEFTVQTLCKKFYISKSQLYKLFEENLRIAPKEFINRKKITAAHNLITGGMPPTKAALQVGYNDYSTFYRSYRSIIGISPRQIP